MAHPSEILGQAPRPTITVELCPMPDGTYDPRATITHMPGGWERAHEALCITLHKIVQVIRRQASERDAQRIVPATSIPHNGLER